MPGETHFWKALSGYKALSHALSHRTQHRFCWLPAFTDVKGPTRRHSSKSRPQEGPLPTRSRSSGARGRPRPLGVHRARTSLARCQSAPGRSPLVPGLAAPPAAAGARTSSAHRSPPLSAQARQLGWRGAGAWERKGRRRQGWCWRAWPASWKCSSPHTLSGSQSPRALPGSPGSQVIPTFRQSPFSRASQGGVGVGVCAGVSKNSWAKGRSGAWRVGAWPRDPARGGRWARAGATAVELVWCQLSVAGNSGCLASSLSPVSFRGRRPDFSIEGAELEAPSSHPSSSLSAVCLFVLKQDKSLSKALCIRQSQFSAGFYPHLLWVWVNVWERNTNIHIICIWWFHLVTELENNVYSHRREMTYHGGIWGHLQYYEPGESWANSSWRKDTLARMCSKTSVMGQILENEM